MNTSQFMDKQILDLMNHQAQPLPQEEECSTRHINGDTPTTKEEILASYDFQSTRTVGFSPPCTSGDTGTATEGGSGSTWGSLGSRTAPSNLKCAGILVPQVRTEVTQKQARTVAPSYSAASVAEIDGTVKKYVDNLFHALEGVSARLSQLESRTHRMESSMDDLKLVVGNYAGATDGKLLQFENILLEVQSGVQILRDKQEIMETQVHLSKLQPQSPSERQPKPSSDSTPTAPTPTPALDTTLALSLQPHQLQAPPPPPQGLSPQPPSLPTPNAPPPPKILYPPQNQNPSLPALPAPNMPQYPLQMNQSATPSVPPYFPSQPQPVDPVHQQPYHQPPQSQAQAQQGLGGYQQSPSHPQPQAQVPPPSQYAPYSPNPTSQPLTEEVNLPYRPPLAQPYPPRGPTPYMQQSLPSGPLPPPSFYGSPPPHPSSSGMFNESPPTNRPGYSPPVDPYPFGGGSPSYRGGPEGMKPNSPFVSGSVGSGGDKYKNLPTAKVLPQAAPVGPGSGSGNRVPLDDVVEKVVMMGFSREQVRETVRKLTENGQNVDLNVVLDKLMNGSAGQDMIQPQKGWFNR
ncbi:pollen-specific leucine-rich repeat extensin-like protein 2 [Carex littledalei]|uniref:Pollen-specific leucine-rich repeat extensin-like protein 2 n=1 Tax=Carex littledalei TaxID=544730 RepID=A0A833QIM7_9POAL|nr:pollen-specific leucine-rich repeat extensin-like protein 2 [Carex littledalei]